MGFNLRWGSIISIFVFEWGYIYIFMGWGCNQEWGFNGADTVYKAKELSKYEEVNNYHYIRGTDKFK